MQPAHRQWVRHFSLLDLSALCQLVRSDFPVRKDVLDGDIVCQKEVADQPPMTAPVDSLRTHHGRSLVSGDLQQLPCGLVKLFREHVVGVAAKTLVPQAQVWRSWSGLLGAPTTAECFYPVVFDPGLLQGRSKIFLVPVRVLP